MELVSSSVNVANHLDNTMLVRSDTGGLCIILVL